MESQGSRQSGMLGRPAWQVADVASRACCFQHSLQISLPMTGHHAVGQINNQPHLVPKMRPEFPNTALAPLWKSNAPFGREENRWKWKSSQNLGLLSIGPSNSGLGMETRWTSERPKNDSWGLISFSTYYQIILRFKFLKQKVFLSHVLLLKADKCKAQLSVAYRSVHDLKGRIETKTLPQK